MRRTALLLGVIALSIGPWLSFPARTFVLPLSSSYPAMWSQGTLAAADGPVDAPPTVRRRMGCTCREVVVNAENVVRDVDVRSGDATVTNSSITYIAPNYGDDEVDVDQEAEAVSGHAIAGQILSVDAGEGCSRVHVRARNIVENADVRSGDAFAHNKSVVLLDPRIQREDLEIEVEQEAEAESGDAIAGQIVGVRGGGGPCGGVIVETLNRVKHVDVRSGKAATLNESDILMCTSPGCIEDLTRMLEGVDSVQVCAGDDCDDVPVDEFVEMLKDPQAADLLADPDRDEDDEEDEADEEEDEEAEEDKEMTEAERRAAQKRAELKARQEAARERYRQYRGDPASSTAVQDDTTSGSG